MSLYTANRIDKPRFFRIAPLVAGRGTRSRTVIGFDSESEDGKPFMFQYSMTGDESNVEIQDLAIDTPPIDAFTSWVHRHCTDKITEYIIVGWNLSYEFSQLFATLPPEVYTLDEFEFIHLMHDAAGTIIARYNVHVWNNKRFMATWVRLGLECTPRCTVDNHKCGSKRRVRFIDGMAFYVTSLANAGAMLKLGTKLAKPERFGRDQSQLPYFRAYARQDAYLTRRIGEEIVRLHTEFDVTQCMSAPHFASKVFKRHFLSTEIPLPPPDLEQAGLASYHGGKNGYYLPGPMHLSNVYSYDITSAYPEAMRALPNIETATWEFADAYEPGVHALWQVSGEYTSCRYRGIMEHGNGFLSTSVVDEVWTTSYELDAALAHGEIRLSRCVGYVMRGTPGTGPLAEYVDRFFQMKRTTTGALRAAAKLFLNSLYGKFFQKVPLGTVGYWEIGDEVRYINTNPDQQFDYQAGGLYHPPIASLITGFVRAKIHALEHKYESVMTSTDGFFARKPPDPADVGTELGMLTVERGDLSIWRERLYSFTKTTPCAVDCGEHTGGGVRHLKFALHGFRGDLDELHKVPLQVGSYSYTAQQVVTLKQSRNRMGKAQRQYHPGTFARLEFTLQLGERAPP